MGTIGKRGATLRAAAPALAGALLAGCASAGHVQPRSEPGAADPHRAAPLAVSALPPARGGCRAAAAARPSGARSLAAVVRGDASIRSGPAGGRTLARVSRLDLNGYPTVLGILGAARARDACRTSAYRVQLPGPPNGRSGWISARAVRVVALDSRIVVDLSQRRLVAYRDGAPVLRARVAIGAPATPTPTGRYFVNERWLLDDPTGAFGVAALGISAHSTVLRDWVQHGPIALHGTDDPASVGQAASHGCIRLRNADMRRLLALAPAGTPVTIRR